MICFLTAVLCQAAAVEGGAGVEGVEEQVRYHFIFYIIQRLFIRLENML